VGTLAPAPPSCIAGRTDRSPTPASRSSVPSGLRPTQCNGQHLASVREVLRLDGDRAGASSFELVRTLCVPRPAHHSAIAALRSCLARSVPRATCSRFHCRTAAANARRSVAQLLARTLLSTTTASVLPGCRALRPHVREPTDSNTTLRGGRGRCWQAHVHLPYPFHRALPPSSPAVLYGSSGEQHAGHLFIPSEIAVASASGPGLGYDPDRKCNSARRDVPGGATRATAATASLVS
jgi:hypothetical protein